MPYLPYLKPEELQQIRDAYPPGTRVELVKMDDVQAPPIGTKGTVKGVDDTGSLLMRWDTGSSLNVIRGEDEVKVIGRPGQGNPLESCE